VIFGLVNLVSNPINVPFSTSHQFVFMGGVSEKFGEKHQKNKRRIYLSLMFKKILKYRLQTLKYKVYDGNYTI
jgi:hypothetical protein